MIACDPKNWLRVLFDFPRSPVFRTNTPIPVSNSSYIKKFVVLYALIMPFGLVRESGYGTVIASTSTFFATMGLELLATEVEEPFGTDIDDLPLDTIGGVIERDAKAILAGS